MGECASRATNCIDFNLDLIFSTDSLFLLSIYINRNKLALNNDYELLTFNMVDVVNKLVLSAKHAGMIQQLRSIGSVLVVHVALQLHVHVAEPLFR